MAHNATTPSALGAVLHLVRHDCGHVAAGRPFHHRQSSGRPAVTWREVAVASVCLAAHHLLQQCGEGALEGGVKGRPVLEGGVKGMPAYLCGRRRRRACMGSKGVALDVGGCWYVDCDRYIQ